MYRAALFTTVVLFWTALAVQIPLDSDPQYNAEWTFDKSPNPNATDHLVFETVHSLLQHWPNTRMRNGHNIIPGRIPKGTLLYRGGTTKELPPGPEFVAMDPEHSYVFCRVVSRHSQEECWHITLATTRSLRVLYFDGSSAAKLPDGSLDLQDLLAWGVSDSRNVPDDPRRIQDLCKWGKGLGLDGFIRMEMSFEVMLCSFTSGVSVVSFANLVGRVHSKSLMSDLPMFEVLNAGSWHNHFPGETRVQLDLAGLVSFYDAELAPSLIDVRAGQERWDHRLQKISTKDLSAAKARLEAILVRPEGLSSGIDWRALIHVIVDRYAGRLERIRYLLNSTITTPDEIIDLANKTQTQLRIILTPYIFASASPTDDADKNDLNWAIPIYKFCSTVHTYSLQSDMESMTYSEKLLLRAVRETTREICRVVTKMWVAGVYAGTDVLLNTKHPNIAELTRLWDMWAEELERLMGWLDWNVWVKCSPACGPKEVCYLPTWPVGFPRTVPLSPEFSGSHQAWPVRFDPRALVMERIAEELWHIVQPELDDWIRPQPRCIRQVDSYSA